MGKNKLGGHTVCRRYSDANIMERSMRAGSGEISTEMITHRTIHQRKTHHPPRRKGLSLTKAIKVLICLHLISTPQLNKRLLRQGVPKRSYRRKIYKYRCSLDGCMLCHEYIGNYPRE